MDLSIWTWICTLLMVGLIGWFLSLVVLAASLESKRTALRTWEAALGKKAAELKDISQNLQRAVQAELDRGEDGA